MRKGCDKRWKSDFGKWVSAFGVDSLAAALQVNRQSIYHWVSGRTFPTVLNAKKIVALSEEKISMQKIYSQRESIK